MVSTIFSAKIVVETQIVQEKVSETVGAVRD